MQIHDVGGFCDHRSKSFHEPPLETNTMQKPRTQAQVGFLIVRNQTLVVLILSCAMGTSSDNHRYHGQHRNLLARPSPSHQARGRRYRFHDRYGLPRTQSLISVRLGMLITYAPIPDIRTFTSQALRGNMLSSTQLL